MVTNKRNQTGSVLEERRNLVRRCLGALIAGIIVMVGVSGCMGSSGFDRAKERLATDVQDRIDHLNDLLTSVEGPQELKDEIAWVGNDLAALPPEKVQDYGGAAGIYDLDIGDSDVAIRIFAVGIAQSGGGWAYKNNYAYSCFQLTGTIDKVPDVKISGDDCDSPLVEAVFQSPTWVYVPLEELGTFSTQ